MEVEAALPTKGMLDGTESVANMRRPDLRLSVGPASRLVECKRLAAGSVLQRKYVVEGLRRFVSGGYGLALISGRSSGALVGAALLGLPMFIVHLARPDGLGFGDVKFGVLLGAGIGAVAAPLVLPAYLLAAPSHTVVCVLVRARGRLVPFGPALAFASTLTVIAGLLGRL